VDRLDLINKPRSFLLRIGANLLHEWRLKAHRARPHASEGLDELVSDADPEAQVAQALRAQRLSGELSKLSAVMRAALVLQARDGLTYEEIALRMNATPRMVKRYLLGAYARLRASLPPDL
jgi:RNA polymerase sigma factor (sigma-70 family)